MQIKGIVEKGVQRAREYGFPTANVRISGSDLPTNGTWAATVQVDDTSYNAAAYCSQHRGYPLCEAYLFNFEGALYGKEVEIELLDHIEPTVPFENSEQMQQKIQSDIQRVVDYFEEHMNA